MKNLCIRFNVNFKVWIISIFLILNQVLCQRNRVRIVYPEDTKGVVIKTKVITEYISKCPAETGSCHTRNDCLSFLDQPVIYLCTLPDRSKGVCCNLESNNGQNDVEIVIRIPSDVEGRQRRPTNNPTISINEINEAGKLAIIFVENMHRLEIQLKERKLLARSGSREANHQNFFGHNPNVIQLNKNGLIALRTTIELTKQKGLNPIQSRDGLPRIDLTNTVIDDMCPPEPECISTKYRSPDASCNNRIHRSWGKSMIATERMLPHAYFDGVDEPRRGVDGRPLPSAREVSLILAPDGNRPNNRYTLMVMQFGQFIDHDLTMTASTRTNDNSPLQCCGEAFERNPELLHPACFSISIPRNDPFFGQRGQTCMSFVRSAPAQRPQCRLGPREQLNQLTSYIDASNIYGSTQAQSQRLRAFRGGRLASSVVNGREFLPFDNGTGFCGIPREQQLSCFVAGDSRVNEQTELTVVHAVWLREHNRVADILSELNPGWNDEVLYQESRRIVAAELQHIIFNEFLPALLGRRVMKRFDLLLTRKRYSDDYSSDINAGIFSGFSTAAFRLHSLIQGTINLQNAENEVFDRLQLRTQFNNPQILYRTGSFDLLVGGLTGQPIQQGDNLFTKDVTNHLFQPIGQPFGMDLVALNIQRGRDHGLPNYNEWRKVCGLERVSSFDELESVMNPNVAQEMSRVYRDINDIDLFIGGVSETPLRGSVVGPTFACIIAEQFRRLKNGDRFWFENGGLESSFTEDQLNEIRKSSLARILCDNSGVKLMQPLAMVQPFDWNPKVRCNSDDIQSMDLRFWRNEPVWT